MAVWSETTRISISKSNRIDSEYFRPEYIRIEKMVRSIDHKNLKEIGDFISGPFGSSFHVKNYDQKSKYRYIRGRDVKKFILQNDDNVYIPESDYFRLEKYALSSKDILISVVGTLGNVAIVRQEDMPAMFSSKSTVLRSTQFAPFFLLAYLNSRFGRFLLLRRQRGAVQTGLNLEDLKSIPVPYLNDYSRNEIASWVETGIELIHESYRIYNQAQQILENELGLDKLAFDNPVGYEVSFGDLMISSRLDAQHFRPQFKTLLEQLKKGNWSKLRDIRTYNRRGVQPVYVEEGEVYVVNSQHIGRQHLDYENLQKTTWDQFSSSPEAHIQSNDLLIYTTGAYVGSTNVYLSNKDALASNHVNILRLVEGIDPAYMALVMQSTIGQLQTDQHVRGSAQAELYPADIDKFIVPIIDEEVRTEIGDLVRNSLEKQRDSKRLLDQAKERVEELIEEAVQT